MSALNLRLDRLLTSVQSTCVLPLDDGARALLRKELLAERAAVLATAARFSSAAGRSAVDLDALRLACTTHQLLQPPIRPHCEFHASVVNSLSVAWPMDGALVVPLAAAGVPEPRGAARDAALPLLAAPPASGGGGGLPTPQPPPPAAESVVGFSIHVPKRARVGGEDA